MLNFVITRKHLHAHMPTHAAFVTERNCVFLSQVVFV